MSRLTALLLAGAATLAGAGIAQAADLGYPPPPPPVAMAVADDFGGWYLRGDIGLGIASNRGFAWETNLGVPIPTTSLSSDVSTAFMFGIGAGYAWNSWFRTDATIEYRFGSTFTAHDTWVAGATNGFNTSTAGLSSVIALANAYVDLGTWSGVTPYVGAGIGMSYNMLGTMQDHGLTNAGAVTGGWGPAGQQAQLAWALMAGFSYDISARTKLDVGYRYLNYGAFKAGGGMNCATPCNNYFRTFNLESHDVRVGLRMALGGGASYRAQMVEPAVMPAPAPAPMAQCAEECAPRRRPVYKY